MTDQSNQDPFQNRTAPAESAPASDPFADQLSMIKNEEGKVKYDSVPKALEGLQHAQSYIPQLKTELTSSQQRIAELEAELAKRASVEDVVSRLQPNQPVMASVDTPQAQTLDEKAVAQLFESFLSQKEQATAMTTNRQKVNETLTSLYGDKAPEVIASKASQLGMSAKELGDLANTKPDLVLALFNAAKQPATSTNTSSFNIPPTNVAKTALERPSKSLLAGATAREQADFMRKIQAEVYAKYGVSNP